MVQSAVSPPTMAETHQFHQVCCHPEAPYCQGLNAWRQGCEDEQVKRDQGIFKHVRLRRKHEPEGVQAWISYGLWTNTRREEAGQGGMVARARDTCGGGAPHRSRGVQTF